MATKPNESQLVTAILKALKLKGVWAWRVNSGLQVFGAEGGRARKVIKGAEAGTPDILLVIPGRDGRLGGIEVKLLRGRQSESQVAWMQKAGTHGVRYGIARAISEALQLVEYWAKEVR